MSTTLLVRLEGDRIRHAGTSWLYLAVLTSRLPSYYHMSVQLHKRQGTGVCYLSVALEVERNARVRNARNVTLGWFSLHKFVKSIVNSLQCNLFLLLGV